jgi:hypothetical protein
MYFKTEQPQHNKFITTMNHQQQGLKGNQSSALHTQLNQRNVKETNGTGQGKRETVFQLSEIRSKSATRM